MGRSFIISGGVRPVATGHYPWPCANQPDRTIKLLADDVLTKGPDGTYILQTGPCCVNIVLTDEQVVPIGKDVKLRML